MACAPLRLAGPQRWKSAVSRKLLTLALGLVLVATTTCADASTDGRACPRIEGAERILTPGAVVMVGELHGTSTIPASFLELVCQALSDGMSVTVALEIDGSEEERIRRYLESAGSDADRSELIQGPFWQSSYQDGRRSLAMVALLSALREMVAEGTELDVVLLDREGFPSAQARDAFMAERIVEVAEAAPEDVVLSLTGDIHSRVHPGVPWDAGFEPMGLIVQRRLTPRHVYGLDVVHPGGEAWICTPGGPEACGPRAVGPSAATASRRGITLGPGAPSHDGVLSVGPLEASPPAAG